LLEFSPSCLLEICAKNGRVSKNENQRMQNEKTIIFINEIKFEEEMKGIEENPSLKFESSRILRVNEKNCKLKKKLLANFGTIASLKKKMTTT